MAETLKTLAQLAPAAASLVALYTVPGATSAVVSTLVVCNSNVATIKFRVSVAVSGAANAQSQYLFYDTAVTKNNTLTATLGISLAATDVVRVYSDTANVSFNLFGVEIT